MVCAFLGILKKSRVDYKLVLFYEVSCFYLSHLAIESETKKMEAVKRERRIVFL